MDKLNVGIVGYWFATNYGGVASYYSLYRAVEQLGYKPFLVESPYSKRDKEGTDVFSRNFFTKINASISDCFEISELKELNKLSDIFLLGSDQVLTTQSIKIFGELFLMGFAEKSKKRIAFSASCGGDNLNIDNDIILSTKSLLKEFSSFSVREYSAINLVKDKFDINADFMIDPIFLTTAEEYNKLAEQSGMVKEDDYVLSYILDPNPDKRQGIYEISAQLGIGKKVALDGRKFTHEKNCALLEMENVTLPELDFLQWLHYFSNASFVFTDSFHGAAMAIILNKPFIMYANYNRGYPRFVTLAELFNLKSRLIIKSSEIGEDLVKTPIDYAQVNKVVEQYKSTAVKWLEGALNNEKSLQLPKTKEVILPLAPSPDSHDGPYYGIESYKNKDLEEFSVCVKSKCTGCAACANICPQNCIEMVPDVEGFVYPKIDHTKCVDCKLCEKRCPALHRVVDVTKKPLDVYAGFSLNNDIRYMSTSGGAFSEFAKYALKMSGVCYGAAYDEKFHVNHVRITSEEEIPTIRQSKYLQSNINHTFAQVKKDLDNGLYVMFCGTPCQCAGLKSFLSKDYKRLIIVDFICHSICSPKAFDYYLQDIEHQFDAKASRVWFKNKETTWKNFSLRIDFEGKEDYYIQTCRKDNYFESFLKYRVCSRPSCHACLFKGTDRAADITLADFWGLKWNNPNYGEEQMKNGVSLIMLNNEKGRHIFDVFTRNQMYIEKHTLEEAVKGNGGYYNSQKPGLYRDYFFSCLGQLPYSEIIQAMRSREEKIHANKLNNK